MCVVKVEVIYTVSTWYLTPSQRMYKRHVVHFAMLCASTQDCGDTVASQWASRSSRLVSVVAQSGLLAKLRSQQLLLRPSLSNFSTKSINIHNTQNSSGGKIRRLWLGAFPFSNLQHCLQFVAQANSIDDPCHFNRQISS